jgi:hypothetical protein
VGRAARRRGVRGVTVQQRSVGLALGGQCALAIEGEEPGENFFV